MRRELLPRKRTTHTNFKNKKNTQIVPLIRDL